MSFVDKLSSIAAAAVEKLDGDVWGTLTRFAQLRVGSSCTSCRTQRADACLAHSVLCAVDVWA